jgi:hypothetical protein
MKASLLLLLLAVAAHGQGLGPSRTPAAAVIMSASNNGQLSVTNWGTCGSTACAGGAGNTTGITQTAGIASPSVSGSSMALVATFPASGNNVLYYWKPAACDTCTWIKFDTWVYVPAGVANYEFDSFIFNKTNGNWDAMFGKQCNTTSGFWQHANQVSGWTNGPIACSLSTSTWHHLIFSDHYNPADTSCAGSVPCQHYDSITIDGVTSSWGGATDPATVLDATWSGIYGCQAQMDSSSASTATEYVDNMSCWVGR